MKSKRLLLGLTVLLLIVAGIGLVGSGAWFSDTEISNDNTITSGTLDLTCDGNNGTNTVKFAVSNMQPGDHVVGSWELCNIGSITGYLDLENITVTSYENGCIEPEIGAGDGTCGSPGPGNGELQNLIDMDLFWDYNAGDQASYIYTSVAGAVASNYEENEPLGSGACVVLVAEFTWVSGQYGDDNLAQGDSMDFDMTFELGQHSSQ